MKKKILFRYLHYFSFLLKGIIASYKMNGRVLVIQFLKTERAQMPENDI